jgi:hypothetical protein
VTEIAISPSMSEYFRAVLEEAIRGRNVDASTAASGYLVGLLCDYAHPSDDAESRLNRPITFLLRDALQAPPAERFQRLRALGDGVLYAAGFFAEHVEQSGVARSYVLGVGATAYRHAAAMLRVGRGDAEPSADESARREPRVDPARREPRVDPARREPRVDPARREPRVDVLGELADKYECFAGVLTDVAEGTLARGARDERSVLRLYERWRKTGSSLLASELGALGIVPTRGKGGVH